MAKEKEIDIISRAINSIIDQGKTETTYQELVNLSNLPISHIYQLFKKYNLQEKIKVIRNTPKRRTDREIKEANLKDCQNIDEPLYDYKGKICLLRDVLYTIALGKEIPEGAETYWINGITPKGLGDTGCTVSNIGIRLKEET